MNIDLAIVGMWFAVGMVGWKNPGAATVVAFFALLGTIAIAGQ